MGVLLLLQAERFKDPAEHGPVLVLGCADWQRQVLKDELVRLQRELRQLEAEAGAHEEDQVGTALTCLPGCLWSQLCYSIHAEQA